MNVYTNTLTLILLALASTTFAAKPVKELVLVSKGSDNGYEDYKISVDKSSIKKLRNNTVMFNLVSSGLSLDETINFEEPRVSDHIEDLANQDNVQVIIVSEMKCNSKELRPLKYSQFDHSTGKMKDHNPSSVDSDDSFESDDLILNNIHKIVC